MIETVFRSEDLPAPDRFAWWLEMTAKSFVPTLMSSDHEADFRATLRMLDLGPVQLSTMTYPSLRPYRTPKLIRQRDPEMFCLSLTLRGIMGLAQSGRQVVLGPQDLMLYDTSQPFSGWTLSEDGDGVAGMILQIPKALMPLPADSVARLTATRLPGQEGVGAVLRAHLCELVRNAAGYTAADTVRVGAITLDLVAAVCAHHLEADAVLSTEPDRQVLQARIHAFIQRNLGDPALSAETVAAAHRISTRHLYRLFQDQGLTVAAWIRQRRLERCRHDLVDPRLRSRPIHAIATRWGFTNSAHFSRLFRTAYDISPADYRNLMGHEVMRESATTVRESSTTS
ncbi:helix-turn-helix domain-containing protein [Streptosporangium sp. NPDC051022]|uniref:AraC-like ligand-binding domain-containing protein n=1 Tax=Streptosporangium sp. NPDC051022 TaxID=3155752 RepID=UPI0034485A10